MRYSYERPSENQSKQKKLQYVTNSLLSYIDTDAVFHSDNYSLPSKTVVKLIMRKKAEQIAFEMNEYGKSIFKSYPSFSYRIFNGEYAEDTIRQGNLFFINHCLLAHLAYSNFESNSVLLELDPDIGQYLVKADKHYRKQIKKIIKNYNRVPKLLKSYDLLQSSVILYETIYELYRTAAYFMMGKGTVQKDLYGQQSYIADFAPSLGTLLDKSDALEREFIMDLKDTCRENLGNWSISVSESQVKALNAKTKWLKKEVDRLFIESWSHCGEKMSRN